MTELYIIAIGAEWCGKCSQAKKKLKPYGRYVQWIDIDSELGDIYQMTYTITNIPFFMLAWNKDERVVTTSKSVMEVVKELEKIYSCKE